jgi:hypothetical protein
LNFSQQNCQASNGNNGFGHGSSMRSVDKKGGLVRLLDIPPDEFLDGALDTGSSVGAIVDCQAECHGNTLQQDVSSVDLSKGVADGVI